MQFHEVFRRKNMTRHSFSRLQSFVTFILVFIWLGRPMALLVTPQLFQTAASQTPAGQPDASPGAIEINASEITPDMLEVSVGDVVTIINNDNQVRTVRLASEGSAGTGYQVFLPIVVRESASAFAPTPAPTAANSPAVDEIITLQPGESVQRTLEQVENLTLTDVEDPTQSAVILVTPGPLTTEGRAVGRVIAYDTKAPIAGAQVRALDTSFETTTGVQGEYQLLLPPGEYTLVMFANGYTFANRKIQVQPYSPFGVDTVELVPLDPVVTPIGPAGGTAVNSDGRTNVVFATGAVTTTEPIRLTVLDVDEFINDYAALPGSFTDGSVPVGFVMFEPDGTTFQAAAEWTIAYDGPLPVGTYVPCYYWIEDEARWGEPVDGYVVDLGNGQKGLQATLPHFSAYGFAVPPPPEPEPPEVDTPDAGDPDRANNNPNESDHDVPCGSQLNLMSGELCQTIGTLGLPSLGGLPTQITAKYSSMRVSQQALVSTTLGVVPGTPNPLQVLWNLTVADRAYSGTDLNVYAEWDGTDLAGNPLAPGVHRGAFNAGFGYASAACPGAVCSLLWTRTISWPVQLVRDDLSSFGIGWFSPHDTLLTNNDPWVTIIQADGRQIIFERQADDSYRAAKGEFSTLTRNADDSWTRTYPEGSTLTFNSDGRLIRIADRYGNFQSILYESNGRTVPPGAWGLTTRIRRVTDTSGNTFDFAYDTSGWLASITDSAGRVYQYEHDAQGHLTAVTDPLGQQEMFTYDADGFMTGHTDARGFATTYVLDGQGRVVSRSWPSGTMLSASYASDEVAVTLDNGTPIVTTLDASFSPVARFNGVYTATTTYSDDLRPETTTDVPLTTLYNAQGNVVEVVAATTLQLERNGPFDQVSRAKSSNGQDTSYSYDAQGNLTGFTDVLGQSYSMTYDAYGQLETITDPLGHTVQLTYDGFGQVTHLTDALGHVWQMGYDPAGNLTSLVDAEQNSTTMTYDTLNRLTEILDALNGTTTMTYDANNNLTGITDPTGRAISYVYDSLNRVTGITYADGGQESFAYDPLGNLISMTDARGQTITWNYDAANRPVGMVVAGGPAVSYDYDDYDQLATVDDGTLQTTLSYIPDTIGLPLQEQQTASGLPLDVTVDYAYSSGAIHSDSATAFGPPPAPGAPDDWALELPLTIDAGSAPANPDSSQFAETPEHAPTALTCDITHSGSIATNLNLDPADGLVHCFNQVTIEAGATVTVPAGVQFAADSGDLIIRGTLRLLGDATDPAVLTSRRDAPWCNGCGDDYRVFVEQNGHLEFQHAEMRYAGFPVSPSSCQLNVEDSARVDAQDSALGIGGLDLMACVQGNGDFYADSSTLGKPNGPEPLNVNSSGVLSVTNSTLLGIDGTGQQGLRINVENVSGLVNGGNVFTNTTGMQRWISVIGLNEITADIVWQSMDSSPGLTGLFFETGLVVRNSATLTAYGPWHMRGSSIWTVGHAASGEAGHLQLLGAPGQTIRIYDDGAFNRFEGLDVNAGGTAELAYVNMNGSGFGGAIVQVRNGGFIDLLGSAVHHSTRSGIKLDPGASATVVDSQVFANARSGLDASANSGPVMIQDTAFYGHTDPAYDPVKVPLASAGGVSGLVLSNNAWNGVRIAGTAVTDVTLAPLPGAYFYTRSFDTAYVSGGSTMTLLPGSELRLSSRLHADGGHIVAAGTPTATVRIGPLQGGWDQLMLVNGGTVTLDHAVLSGSSGSGIHQTSSGGALLIHHSLIGDNAHWGVLVDNPAAGVTITTSSLVNNGSGGVLNNQPGVADVQAALNYWGDPAGPGQMASSGVLATPWSAAFALPGDGRVSNVSVTSNGNAPQSEAYDYDLTGRLTTLSSSGYSSYTVAYTYDAASRLLGRTPLAGLPLTATYDYDDADRLTDLTLSGPGGVLHDEQYSYDAVGNVTGIVSSRDGVISYTYDDLNRLTGVTSPGFSDSYTYDAAGNRLTAGGASYTYDAGGRLISSSDGITYGYDAAGNLISKTQGGQATSYTWDGQNRLTHIDYPDGTHSAYAYDDFGRRISKRLPDGSTIYYVYDGLNLAQELDGTGAVVASYTYDGLDRPVTMWRDGQTYTYLLDRLGSVLGLVDASGVLIASYRYDPWGNVISSTGTLPNPLRFTSREYDEESGLYYYRARYYDAGIGRFISRDPIGVTGGLNLYAYVHDNPVNLSDPKGLIACGGFCLAVIAGLVSAAIWAGLGEVAEFVTNPPPNPPPKPDQPSEPPPSEAPPPPQQPPLPPPGPQPGAEMCEAQNPIPDQPPSSKPLECENNPGGTPGVCTQPIGNNCMLVVVGGKAQMFCANGSSG
jgi:RHS repeat-associated protein